MARTCTNKKTLGFSHRSYRSKHASGGFYVGIIGLLKCAIRAPYRGGHPTHKTKDKRLQTTKFEKVLTRSEKECIFTT